VLGDTDSETIFFIFLTLLQERKPSSERPDLPAVVGAVQATLDKVRSVCSQRQVKDEAVLLTFIVTDGDVMVATQGGKELSFSTYKRRCPDRATCPSLSSVCEGPTLDGRVNHLIVSSERLQGSNVWEELAPGDILAIDGRMSAVRTSLGRRGLVPLGAAPSGLVTLTAPASGA
jgi:glutamine amidotransferase